MQAIDMLSIKTLRYQFKMKLAVAALTVLRALNVRGDSQ
jgi:hypothetical protein